MMCDPGGSYRFVFSGGTLNAAFIKGLFQVSDSYITISSGDRYGNMEITESNINVISMENSNPIQLSPETPLI